MPIIITHCRCHCLVPLTTTISPNTNAVTADTLEASDEKIPDLDGLFDSCIDDDAPDIEASYSSQEDVQPKDANMKEEQIIDSLVVIHSIETLMKTILGLIMETNIHNIKNKSYKEAQCTTIIPLLSKNTLAFF